ncbi:hypothetical protein P153DRAFT_53913 [Dothidotthia symphoricarpi CBS 119687]|uniref:Uncharacterized protein n=1 Tax=Dothidotthia symphoricarpi CBS 119687 TaxID=1392245 RepID=A0A6A6AA31_9PLEO|nr:uncharacterized protein P153DRAFT_53913 [Dothidotthia symphoricarpi CBS 119687]KAF2127707.1 hypothetical protein P153DRAFT_53913 [Dothidotthia symphoricarpi CBS 119687]
MRRSALVCRLCTNTRYNSSRQLLRSLARKELCLGVMTPIDGGDVRRAPLPLPDPYLLFACLLATTPMLLHSDNDKDIIVSPIHRSCTSLMPNSIPTRSTRGPKMPCLWLCSILFRPAVQRRPLTQENAIVDLLSLPTHMGGIVQ